VTNNQKFNGQLADIDSNFIKQLKILVPLLLHPSNLIVKKIGDQEITGHHLIGCITEYFKMFSGTELPEPRSLVVTTAELNNVSAMRDAQKSYESLMEQLLHDPKFIKNLKEKHNEYIKIVLNIFDDTKKMGGREHSKPYRENLIKQIEDKFKFYNTTNESKKGRSALSIGLEIGAIATVTLGCIVCEFVAIPAVVLLITRPLLTLSVFTGSVKAVKNSLRNLF
jgi:atlastin